MLGLFIDPKLKWRAHIDIIAQKMNSQFGSLRRITFATQPFLKPFAIWRLYEALIEPIWLTNIEIYSNNMIEINKQIKPIYHNALRLTLGQSFTNPNLHKIRKILQAKTIEEKIDLKLTQFYLRCKLAKPGFFQAQNWISYKKYLQNVTSMYNSNNAFLQNITLWRAECKMQLIMNELNNTQDDDIPKNLHKEIYDKYICGIKFNSN